MLNLPPRISSRLNSSQFANLHTFLVAARHLSFARAAHELCLTASAVSHRISRLETALDMKLFQRLTRQVTLTDEGERIFEILQNAMGELSEALEQSSQAEVAGSLAVYVRPSIAQCWLVPRLADFVERYPWWRWTCASAMTMSTFAPARSTWPCTTPMANFRAGEPAPDARTDGASVQS